MNYFLFLNHPKDEKVYKKYKLKEYNYIFLPNY